MGMSVLSMRSKGVDTHLQILWATAADGITGICNAPHEIELNSKLDHVWYTYALPLSVICINESYLVHVRCPAVDYQHKVSRIAFPHDKLPGRVPADQGFGVKDLGVWDVGHGCLLCGGMR
jgi:hypothetical protein